jgi:iron complex outermembrane recepter protein
MNRSLLARSIHKLCLSALGAAAVVPSLSVAQEEPVELGTLSVEGDAAGVMPTEPVESVFGFGKTALETPRSMTSISKETLDKIIITEIDDLVALSPGSFTQSFFGVAGSLDVRGNLGENYFRGMKRIDNPGNYPTPIGASDRIDIVRGPASPIYGPSKIGGYLNFVPKSARASTGQYLTEPKTEIGITTGSWDKKVVHGEVGGPAEIFGKKLGYYLYTEFENSGSYYDNTSTDQSLYQASFDMTVTDQLRLEFGGMYHDFRGNQVAGWNRLTQDLIDHGTYITGSPPSLDANGDGYLSDVESTNGNLNPFIPGPQFQTPAENAAALSPEMALLNPGTTHIDGSTVLVQEDDTLEDEVITLYFDAIYDLGDGMKLTNKTFYESLDNVNENLYGFSQFADTWVFEDQLVFAFSAPQSENVTANFQVSPSIRHQDFEHGDNFDFEYFDRRDITLPGSPIDRRGLATRGQEFYSSHTKGKYTDYGLGAMMDLTLFKKLNILGGARYDYIDMESETLPDSTDSSAGLSASDKDDSTSWSVSVSYDLPFGVRPYVTIARQSTLLLGQGGQIPAGNVDDGSAISDSDLDEYGVKTSMLDGRLYMALDYFKQERVDFNAQDTVTSNTTQTKGWEFEARFVVTPMITLTGAYTKLKLYNLNALNEGEQFSFAGAEDLGVDPSLMFGGSVASVVFVDGKSASRKAGTPEEMYSLYSIFTFPGALEGVTASLGATHVSSVYSGFSQAVKLPSYTLVNAGINYDTGHWQLSLQGKNLTDEEYFRSNFPDLFGSSVVLPELPRSYLVSASYKF